MKRLRPLWETMGKTWRESKTGKVVMGCAGLVFLCALCAVCGWLFSFTPQYQESARRIDGQNTATALERVALANATATENARPTRTALPTVTTEPTRTRVPTDMPDPTEPRAPTNIAPTADTTAAGVLPGLAPVDVTLNLKQRGFECTGVEQGKLYFQWTCSRRDNPLFDATIFIYARTLNTVDLVDATVLQFAQPTDEIPNLILGFLATLPYDGATPEAARAWVEKELPTLKGEGDVREMKFGSVTYRLYGIPTARILEIGDLE